MQKVKTFWYSLKHTITDFNYYKDILKAPFSFSLKFLVFFLFVVAFLQGVFFAGAILTLVPKVPEFVRNVELTAKSFYPQELVVTVKNGIVSTNVQEPYYVQWPAIFRSGTGNDAQRFITIDTNAHVEDYKKYNTLVLVIKNAVVTDSNQGVKVNFLDGMKGSFVINRQIYDQTAAKILVYLKYATPILFLVSFLMLIFLPFVILFFTLSFRMVYLLFGAAVVMVLAKIMKVNIEYKKIYQLCMHAVTIPILLTTVGDLVSVHIPYLFTGILAIWMYFVLKNMQTSPAPASSNTPNP